MKIVAVIPAYNEERNIGKVIRDVKPRLSEVIVVDDGSSDATGDVAVSSGAHALTHRINRGQGAALRTGTEFALRRMDADIVVHYDADGQHAAEEIDDMVKPILLGGVDVVLGSRFLKPGTNVPFFRKVVLKGGIIFTRFTSGLRVTDTHNGFRAFSRAAAEKIKISQDRMAHASEIFDQIAKNNLRFCEVPVTIRYTKESRQKGQSSLNSFRIVLDYFVGRLFKS
ncbi:glycosyltransferase family 2 protein [Patescibacteria group bacterium]|nr:glycosyltransferase family 2 protein [Patescibacteria group bacterium]MBU1921768.1 glycosyltransferase family 2 protein [Patescibacteria group bacterium]